MVLQANINFTNELWYIPIQKTRLQEENYVTPEQHGYTYTTPKVVICKQQVKKIINKEDSLINIFEI